MAGVTSLDRAAQLHARGVALHSAGTPNLALRTLHRALRHVPADGTQPTRVLTGRILLSIAASEGELHGAASGLTALEAAERAVTESRDSELRVLLLAQRGFVFARTGNFDAAVADLDAAIARREAASDYDQVAMLVNRGSIALMLGDLRVAEARLHDAVEVAVKPELRQERFKSLHNLAYVRFLRGDLPGALLEMDEALALGDDLPRGVPLLDRARVLVEAGLTSAADETLATAVDIFRTGRLGQDVAETEYERARCALIAGDIPEARRLAGSARDRFRRRGADSWRRTAELLLLQGDLAAGRPGRRLAAVGLRLRAEFEAAGQPTSGRTAALIAAESLLSVGGGKVGGGAAGASAGSPTVLAAAALLAQVPAATAKDPITVRLHDCLVRARLHQASGNTRAATGGVRSGLRQLVTYQASFGSIDLQTAAAVHGQRLAELGVTLALDSGRPGAVLAAAEHARAVSSRLPVVRPPADPEAAALLAELRQTVESLHAAGQHRTAVEELTQRRRDLERRITQRRWSLAGSGDALPAARVDELSAELERADARMVVLVEARGQLHAVVLDGPRVRLRALGASAPLTEQVRRARADLDVLAMPLLSDAMREVVGRTLAASLAELDDVLIRPLAAPGRRLVIVSTGVFGQLPWGALPSLRGVPVVVAPSATSWLTASSAGEWAGAAGSVIAFAGPDLERGEHEVRGIETAWPGAAVHVGGGAVRAELAEAMAKGRIVHVAAHGVHQTENPLFSSVHLADGPLFAHELDENARTPDHVVLSACELGLATVRPGDEALGLTSVLLHLGTRSVVAGVARVNDELAAETMIAYHRRLAAGQDSAAALAAALESMDASAPFVCFGASWADPI